MTQDRGDRLRGESGQALTEYMLILAVCAVAAASFSRRFIAFLDEGMLRVAGQMEKDLKSGRSALDTWLN